MREWMMWVAAVVLILGCASAYALTGSGESAENSLETVSPMLNSVSAVTEQSLSATFSEPMLTPGVTTPGNYAASGAGAGTLTGPPHGCGRERSIRFDVDRGRNAERRNRNRVGDGRAGHGREFDFADT